MFTLLKKDSSSNARKGLIKTSHGVIETPVFMPVATRGAIRALTLADVESLDFDIIFTAEKC